MELMTFKHTVITKKYCYDHLLFYSTSVVTYNMS